MAVALALVALGMGGCGIMYLNHAPVVRPSVAALPPVPPQAARTGSLWRDNVSANYLFTDVKAHYPGDLLTIVISENDSGSKDATTSSKTKTSVAGSLTEFFSLPQQWQQHNPNINPAALIEATADREWDGSGATTRNGKLSALMTVEVTALSPNGNLWVEGEKVVAVNHEDQHLEIAGWVRPEDIDAQNQVPSARIALGRIDYYGMGVIATKQRPGWGYQVLDWIWPF